MVKTINVAFDDNEHTKLMKIKGEKSWHDFIIELADKVPQEADPSTK